MRTGSQPTFLEGRDRYYPVLQRALKGASGGVLYGNAGAGKTFLLRRWAEVLFDAGHQTLSFAACAATRDIALGAFASTLGVGQPTDRAHAVQMVAERLLELGGEHRLALVVDDAHLLDDASVAVIHQLLTASTARPAAFSVWLSVRSGEPVDPTLVELWRSDRLHRIDLDALTRNETSEVATALIGSAPSDALTEALYERSQGVPLYIRELINDATASGAIASASNRWELVGELAPGRRLTDLLRHRFQTLSEIDRSLVDLVALTEPLPVDVMSPEEGDRLESLHDRGLVSIVAGDGRLEYLPGHPLIGEVALRSIPVPRQHAILAAFGERLARRDHLPPGLALRAGRWALDGKLALPPKLLAQASSDALAAYDLDLATRLAEAALALEASSRTHEALGTVLHAAGEHQRAEHHLRIAQETAPDDETIVRISHSRSILNAYSLGDTAVAIALLNEAAAAVSDPVARLSVHAHTSGLAVLLGSFADVIAVSDQLLERSDMTGSIRAQVLGNLAYAESSLLQFDDFDAHVKEAIELIVEHRDANPGEIDLMWGFIAGSYICRGNFGVGADEVAQSLADRTRQGLPTAVTAYSFSKLQIITGDATALETAELALAQHTEVDVYGNMPQVIGIAAQVAALSGDLDAARGYLDRVDLADHADDHRTVVAVGRGRAALLAAEGDHGQAARTVAEAGQSAIAARNPDLAIPTLHDAVRFGHPDLVVDAIESMMPTGAPDFFTLLGDHARASADTNAVAIANCATRYASAEAWLYAAEAWAEAANLVRATNGDANLAGQYGALAEAVRRRCSLDCSPMLDRLEPALTERELDVSLDVALGLMSREVAERRFISARTVDNHLRKVYRRLGLGGRDELAALLAPVLPKARPESPST